MRPNNIPDAEKNFKLKGRYRLDVFKQDDEGNEIPGSRREVDWFDNLITNYGLDNIGIRPNKSCRGCQVGSGSTAPNFTDTALASRVGSSVNRFSTTSGRDYTDPLNRFMWRRRVYRFVPGTATGNITEVGVCFGDNDSATTGGALSPTAPLFSRALILDGGGSPVTITVAADETLDVTYEERVYIPDNVDVTGVLTFDGVSTNWTLRNCEVNDNPGSANTGGWALSVNDLGFTFEHRQSSGFGENQAYVGASSAIVAETGEPTGTERGLGGGTEGSVTTAVYVSGNFYVDITHSWGLAAAGAGTINDPNGVGAARFVTDLDCSFQVGFSPRIAKTADKILSYTLRLSWARA